MTMQVQPGDAVLVHVNLLLADGSVAESSRANGKPAKFQLGDGSLSEAIEHQLLGLAVGDKKKFTVAAEEGFGERQTGLIQFRQRHEFPSDMEIAEGVIIVFTLPNGAEMPGVVRELNGDSVTVDFNHPLAGKALTFDLEVVAINP
ncbi:FKBP-type peptidyl-prolyl cis-trans isomerase [Permianibacter sp. IMCC34836]|uniref:FKBP-type peptidyl-prolyl cis-trans isomerase n=1 Tax=Permianibacter fluminis TaxID=2738515 RepID=UPI001552588C|nr:FKBP-type peptidyl-prolyl cis-trans isomerase [Permianibacter fluminis]NQD37691.1 FKBP-type peptidyl-prolyl cis-trans isomerase [Permianibacter fluminis]